MKFKQAMTTREWIELKFWIAVRHTQGWRWSADFMGSCFVPPEDHYLRNACAMWIDMGNEQRVPHWIARGGLKGCRNQYK